MTRPRALAEKIAEEVSALCPDHVPPSTDEWEAMIRAEVAPLVEDYFRLQWFAAQLMLYFQNQEREDPSTWPAGQSWDGLAQTSKEIFARLVRQGAEFKDHSPTLHNQRVADWPEEADRAWESLDKDALSDWRHE